MAEELTSQGLVRPQTKKMFQRRHIQDYFRDYNRPLIDNECAAMPFVRIDGKLVLGDDNKPQLDEIKIDDQENSAPSCHAYWENLIKLDKLNKSCNRREASLPDSLNDNLSSHVIHQMKQCALQAPVSEE